ncbi:MAG TPA: Gfo/Idh/MocA family oxidoreductase [Terriglobales bacterium]|nr:Gfo/Idh/MocA family oxidoreductase [Terriglobales bacterium]
MPEPLKIGVVGCGVFGRHHARVLAQAPGAQLVGVFDTDPERAQALAQEFRTRAFASLDELERTAAAAVVAAPTVAHAEVAIRLLDAGLDVLVEKPIAPSLAEADRMTAAAAARGRILMVGHLERFNPAVRLIRARLTRPLFFEVHRLSLFTPRSLDVDVLLDLMIHDLDIVLSFVNSPLADLQAVGLAVLSARTDIANVRLSFANGCVANLTASRVSTEKVRKLRFFQPGEYISLDYARRDARVFAVAQNPYVPPVIEHQHLVGDDREPLAAELDAFLEAVRTRAQPEVDGPAARAALAAALRAAQAIAHHHQQLALDPGPPKA